MSLHRDIIELLTLRDVVPTRRIRIALAELLAVVAAGNPDLPSPEDRADDGDGGNGDDDAGLAVRIIDCPHCGEPVVVELELDGGDQEAIHDCSVCCQPIRLVWQVSSGRLDDLESGPG